MNDLQDTLLSAHRAACYELVTKPHPLSPELITEAQALDLMRRAVEKQGGQWMLLYIGYYILSTAVDAAVFWPDAAIVAVSHCPDCGDVLCQPLQATCRACQEDRIVTRREMREAA